MEPVVTGERFMKCGGVMALLVASCGSALPATAVVTLQPQADVPSRLFTLAQVATVDASDAETAQALRDGGPWGQAFPEPCFDGVFAIKNARVVGEKHLKMWVTTADQSRAFDAIAFNFKGSDGTCSVPDGDVRLVYRLDINEYKGERRPQLLVDHVMP